MHGSCSLSISFLARSPWSREASKCCIGFHRGMKLTLQCINNTSPGTSSRWSWRQNKSRKRKKRLDFFFFLTFGPYANVTVQTGIEFGSACWKWIKGCGESQMMREWLGVRGRPDTDYNYHKPYACSLWSGCKIKMMTNNATHSTNTAPSLRSFLITTTQTANRISISGLIHW